VKKGYEIDVYNRKGKNVLDKNSKANFIKEYNGAKVINVPTINKKGLEATVYSLLASIKIAFGKYDYVHYHAERKLCNALDSKIIWKKNSSYNSWLRLAAF
jgi:hypothetical protein